MTERQQLTELQIAILRLLWERGEATIAELESILADEHKLRGVIKDEMIAIRETARAMGAMRPSNSGDAMKPLMMASRVVAPLTSRFV